jgi:hypothetical protein
MIDPNTLNILRMQDTFQELVANIKAIQKVLYDKGLTDPVSLARLHEDCRKMMDETPEVKKLKSLLKLLEDVG